VRVGVWGRGRSGGLLLPDVEDEPEPVDLDDRSAVTAHVGDVDAGTVTIGALGVQRVQASSPFFAIGP
jgi:hypothetical protein